MLFTSAVHESFDLHNLFSIWEIPGFLSVIKLCAVILHWAETLVQMRFYKDTQNPRAPTEVSQFWSPVPDELSNPFLHIYFMYTRFQGS